MNKILLIHYDQEAIEHIGKVLRTAACQLLTTHSGGEGVTLAQLENPDALLLAFPLPKTDCFEILELLKRHHLTRDIPVLFVAEEGISEEDIVRGLELGAADYLIQPYREHELIARVRLLIRLREDQRRLREQEEHQRKLMDSLDQGFFMSSREGRFIDCNPALIKMLGYNSSEELKQIDISKDLYVNPDDRKTYQALMEKQGFVKDFKVDLRRKDGKIITVLLTGTTLRDEGGVVVGYEGFNIDITAREKALSPEEAEIMEKLRSSEAAPMKKMIADLVHKFRPQLEPFFASKKVVELIAGKYEKVKELGMGRFGVVWKVRDAFALESDNYYVLKIPMSKDYNQRFLREGRILKKMEGHPAAIHLKEMVEDNEKLILVQEFVEGQPLQERLDNMDKQPLTGEEKERIMLELTEVVAFAHERGIIHRDIKPDNIFLRSDGAVKLLDFGIAKELKGEAYSRTSVGTKPFMAPEQIMGKGEKRSDLWAVGVLMYQLYTGYLPFYDDVEIEMMNKIMEAEPVLPRKYNDKIDPQIEAIILKCLQKNPQMRYQSAVELLAELKKIFAVEIEQWEG